MTLVALFAMTTGAWADNTVYTSGQSVRIVDLKVGDIILPGATVTRDGMATPTNQKLKFRRCTTEWVDMSESLPVTFDENAGLGDYHVGGKPLQPIDENGNVGNAWQVAVLTLEPFGYIATLDGITYRDPNAIVLTTDAAKEGDPFTTASFEMPAYDATVDYELVRDMSVDMPITVGDGTDGYRIRLKKNGSKWEPAEMTPQAMAGLIVVTDDIEQSTLTNVTDYTVSIYAVDDNDQPTGNAIAFADLEPGRYVAFATAKEGTIYDGETEPSNIFVLFQGYEVEVAAKEFITYYKDEPLYADTESSADAVLYTISSVSADQATLSAAIQTAPSLTPLLIFNNSDEAKTFLLIPAIAEPNLALTVAPEFVGTLEDTQIPASTTAISNYAFNGLQFVWVKNALAIGANKAWLSISNSNARQISLVFDNEATGIQTSKFTKETNSEWYTIDGRKVTAPTKKGVYIQNGKKVVK